MPTASTMSKDGSIDSIHQEKHEDRDGLNGRESDMDGKIASPMDESRAGETLARPLERSRAKV